ncbi:flagellar hook-length control protein FliK [Devosia sp.]|uniref:flagellar hook-length control protein FliK n=1 Tax=Devosia sp. TaxID=1871048 RepID=UPI003F711E0F
MSDVATALLQLTGRTEPAADPALAAVKLARASLDALLLRLGQSIDAKVTGQLAGGLTQLTAGGESFVLKLETPLPANTAVTLKITPTPTGQPAVTVSVQPQPALAQPAPPTPQARSPLQLPLPQAPVATAAPPAPAAGQAAPLAPPSATTVSAAAPSTSPMPSLVAAPSPPSQPPSPVPTVQAPLPAPQTAAPPPLPIEVSLQPAPPAATPTAAAAVQPAPAQPMPAAIAIPPGQPAPLAAGPAPAVPATTPMPSPSAPAPQPASPVAAANTPATANPLPAPQGAVSGAAPPPPIVSGAPSPTAPPPPIVSGALSPAGTPQLVATPTLPPVATQAPPSAPAVPLAAPTAAMSRPAVQPVSPPLAQILADPVQAAARQDSILPLIARLETLAAPTAAALPRPALEAIAVLLGTRLDLNRAPPDGKAIREAVLRAGIIAEPGARTPADAKSALLQLRSALAGFLGSEVEAVAPITRRPPPPLKGEPVRAPSTQPGPPLADEPSEAARQLLGHADAALSRAKLLQLASSPADSARPGSVAPAAELRVEVPMQLGAETGILQLLVERDGKHKRSPAERGWRLRFALNFTATGEVGAEVALLGRSANVTLWAADPVTADALEAMLPELSPALARHGLDVAALRVRRGAPHPIARAPGQLLDSAR